MPLQIFSLDVARQVPEQRNSMRRFAVLCVSGKVFLTYWRTLAQVGQVIAQSFNVRANSYNFIVMRVHHLMPSLISSAIKSCSGILAFKLLQVIQASL